MEFHLQTPKVEELVSQAYVINTVEIVDHQDDIQDVNKTMKLIVGLLLVLVILKLLLNVDALRAVQTSGPNDTKHVLVTRGPIFISGKVPGRYIEQTKKTKHRSTRLKQMS